MTFLIAYPIVSLDQIGIELQDPFSPRRIGHLPLDQITAKIEANVLALLDESDRVRPLDDAGRGPLMSS